MIGSLLELTTQRILHQYMSRVVVLIYDSNEFGILVHIVRKRLLVVFEKAIVPLACSNEAGLGRPFRHQDDRTNGCA